ncbi:MAG: hypothetical protein WCJ56_07160, partial [bacterium]
MRPVIRVKGRNRQHRVEQIPNLIEVQLNSYRWFLREGLRELFDNFSPITDFTGNLRLSFGEYTLGEPKYPLIECRDRDATHEAPLKVQVQLLNTTTGEMKESEVYLGDLPIMTDTGTFIINGAERAVVSQLARSPGVYFKSNIDYSGKILYSAQVIPSEGAWLDFDTDANGVISVKIGQAHRFPATTLLRAMHSINTVPGHELIATNSDADIINLFGYREELINPAADDLVLKRAAEDIVDINTGEVLVEKGVRIDRATALKIGGLNLEKVAVIQVNSMIEATLEKDPTRNEDQALVDIYRRDRPGDPVTPELARQRLSGIFADPRRYDQARVGRYKLNKKLGMNIPEKYTTLTKEDLLA